MTSSLEHVINEIVRSTAPVLFIDTCIYLDVIRSPIRTNISKDTAKWAKILTGKAKEKVFWLVTCKTIQDEWQDNVSNVVSELDREAKKMETSNLHFHSVLSSIDNEYVKPTWNGVTLGVAEGFKKISESMLNESMVIECEDKHSVSAMSRIKRCIAPASKGKLEPKDCEIFEVFLDMAKRLRDGDYSGNIYFVSSNTTDYRKDNSKSIDEELAFVSSEFIPNLSLAGYNVTNP
ncbi:PIN domain-containing protein [Citrobacter freundii]